MSEGNRYAKYRVGCAALLTFMQIKPGNEKTVVSKLYKGFPEAIVCKVFGDSDVCMIQRFEDWFELPSFTETHQRKDMSNVRSILAFGWANLDRIDATELHQYPALGICFLKANRAFLSKSGVKGEHLILAAITRESRRAKSRIKVSVFGTLGWHETIIIISGKRICDVLNYANALRRAVIVGNGESASPCFETTVTVPAIFCGADGTPQYADIGPKTRIQVRISCHSWADTKVKSLLDRHLGPAAYVAGTDDFIVRNVPEKTLSEYTNRLWEFRKVSSGMVYRTRTAFLVRQSDTSDNDWPISEANEESIGLPVDSPRLKLLRDHSLTLHQLLLETYSRLNDILMDPRKSSAFKDLRPFADKLLSTLLEPESSSVVDYIDNPRILGQQLELLLFGMRQRCVGMEVGDSDCTGEPYYTGNSVGIQRILNSVTSLPKSIMKKLDMPWSGFIVVGFTETYHRYFEGPINMPVEAVYNPELWFGVFHEIGHEYSTQLDIMNNAPLRKALGESAAPFRDSLVLASEVYSEIFGCLFTFGGDFDRYLKSTWEYLGKLLDTAEKVESLLLRFLLTYIFFLEEAGDKYISDKADLAKVATMLRKKVQDYVAVTDIDDELLDRICDRAIELRTALDILKRLTPTMTSAEAERRRYSSMVKKGAILLNVTDPIAFIQQVIHISPLSFRGATALILSLWNSEIQQPT